MRNDRYRTSPSFSCGRELLRFRRLGCSIGYIFASFLIVAVWVINVKLQQSPTAENDHDRSVVKKRQSQQQNQVKQQRLDPANSEQDHQISYEILQKCIDQYSTNGAWNGSKWQVSQQDPSCQFLTRRDDDDDTFLASVLQKWKIGFLGDSTTRSDLRAWEERFRCERTNLDEAQVFQRKYENGSYICEPWEQSINLTKCGIPPVIDVNSCPRGASFRYIYKIYPWTPLDEWYLSPEQHPSLFGDLDVVVLSLGRWFVYYEPYDAFNITKHMETFLTALKKVYNGTILYQSEYSEHLKSSKEIKFPVPCDHATCEDCPEDDMLECEWITSDERPPSDVEMRAVFERFHILHLDRWNISQALPLEYFEPWYCNNETYFNQWDCSHHLRFVAMQHMRLIGNVVHKLLHRASS